MNELAVLVRYRPLTKAAAIAICVSWFAFFVTAWYILWPSLPSIWYVRMLLWFVGGLLFVYGPFVIVSFYREGGLLVANARGIAFPSTLMGFGPRRSLGWESVKLVDYRDQGKQRLCLKIDGGEEFTILTDRVSDEEVEQLLLAMEVWSPRAAWSERASDFRDGLQNKKIGIESEFTRLWEAELKRRFSVTTFAPHQPGVQLQNGRFKILKQLAFGGFAAVYLAEDEDRQQVVLKELVMQDRNSEAHHKALAMFEREASLLSRVNHNNVARVMDHFVENDRHYLVLEYIDGESLRDLVRRKGALPESTVVSIGLQVLAVLEYLHGLEPPLIHRDLTPENLLLSASGSITVVDFGAANEFASLATGTLIGKQSYMPLEQIRGKAEPRSDLYALGGTMYFLLEGIDPQPLSTLSSAIASSTLADFILRLTQAEPQDRFANASEARLALERLSCAVQPTQVAENPSVIQEVEP